MVGVVGTRTSNIRVRYLGVVCDYVSHAVLESIEIVGHYTT